MKDKTKRIQHGGLTFFFKYNYDPISDSYLPHIFIRHCIDCKTAIKAYLSRTKEVYKEKKERYEAYSEEYNLELYYFHPGRNENKIYIIMAAYPR